jgi:hypothetical protein
MGNIKKAVRPRGEEDYENIRIKVFILKGSLLLEDNGKLLQQNGDKILWIKKYQS